MLVDASFNAVTGEIIGAALEVHRGLGPGLLESTYMPCLQYELSARGLRFQTQVSIPIVYKELRLANAYRIDLIVEDLVVVEIKSVEALAPVHDAQVITYLMLTGKPVGLLINFNVPKLMQGVRRLLRPKRNRLSSLLEGQGTKTSGE